MRTNQRFSATTITYDCFDINCTILMK